MLDTTITRLQQVIDTTKEVVEAELKSALANSKRMTYVEHFRTLLFQDALLEAVKYLSQAMYIVDITDDGLYQMCAKEGLTVQEAIHNFMANTMQRDLSSLPRDKAVNLVLDAMEEYDKYKRGKSQFN